MENVNNSSEIINNIYFTMKDQPLQEFKFSIQKKGTEGNENFLNNTNMNITREVNCENDLEDHIETTKTIFSGTFANPTIKDNNIEVNSDEAKCIYTEPSVKEDDRYIYDIYEVSSEKGYKNILGNNMHIKVIVDISNTGKLSANYYVEGVGDYIPTQDEISNVKSYITGVTVIEELRTISLIIENPEQQSSYAIKAKKVDDKNQPKSGVLFTINETLKDKNETVSRGPTGTDGIVTIESDVPINKNNFETTDIYTISEVDVGQNKLLKLNESVTINVKKQINPITNQYEVESATFDNGTTSKTVTLENGSSVTTTLDAANNIVTITIPNKDTTSINVKKDWIDNNNEDNKRPEGIILQLYKISGTEKIEVGNSVTLTAGEDKVWQEEELKYSWEKLEKYDDNGNEIQYTVDEIGFVKDDIIHDLDSNGNDITGVDVNGYTWRYIKNIDIDNDTIIIKNRYPNKYKLYIRKIDDAGNPIPGVTFNLTGNIRTTDENGLALIGELSMPDEDGTVFTWGIIELKLPEGKNYIKLSDYEALSFYTGKVVENSVERLVFGFWPYSTTNNILEKNVTLEDGTEVKVTLEESDGVITLTLPNKAETEHTIKKEWKDGNNCDGLRPGSITVQLYADGIAVDGKQVTLTSGDDGIWQEEELSYTWKNLDKYNNGHEIVYTADEITTIDGYNKEVENSTDVTKITNEHNPEPTQISVVKKWDDYDDANGYRPEHIFVQIYKDGQAYEGNSEIVAFKELNKSNNWTYTWYNLNKYENGNEINWTVKEVTADKVPLEDGIRITSGELSGYTPTYDVTSTPGTTIITNTNKSIPLNLFKCELNNINEPVLNAHFFIRERYNDDAENDSGKQASEIYNDNCCELNQSIDSDGTPQQFAKITDLSAGIHYYEIEEQVVPTNYIKPFESVIVKAEITEEGELVATITKIKERDTNTWVSYDEDTYGKFINLANINQGKALTVYMANSVSYEFSLYKKFKNDYNDGVEIKDAEKFTGTAEFKIEKYTSEGRWEIVRNGPLENAEVGFTETEATADGRFLYRITETDVSEGYSRTLVKKPIIVTIVTDENGAVTQDSSWKYEYSGDENNEELKKLVQLEIGTNNQINLYVANTPKIRLKLFKHELGDTNKPVEDALFLIRQCDENGDANIGWGAIGPTRTESLECFSIEDLKAGEIRYYEIWEFTVPTDYKKEIDSVMVKVEKSTDGESSISISKVKINGNWIEYNQTEHEKFVTITDFDETRTATIYIANTQMTESGEYTVQLLKKGTNGTILEGVQFTAERKVNGASTSEQIATAENPITSKREAVPVGDTVTIDRAHIGEPDTYTLKEINVGNNTKYYIGITENISITINKTSNVSADGGSIIKSVSGIELNVDGATVENNKATLTVDGKPVIVEATLDSATSTITITVENPEETKLKLFKHELGDKTKPVPGAEFLVRQCDENGDSSIAYGGIGTTTTEKLEVFTLKNIQKGDVYYFELYEFTTPEDCIRDLEKVVVKTEVTQEGQIVYTPHLVKMVTDTQYVPYSQTTHGDYVSIGGIDESNTAVIYIANRPKTQRTVKKVWSDGDDLDGIRPTEIQVALYVGANMYTTSDSPKTLSAGEDGIWQESELTYTWTNLPKYLDGVEIPYEVREVNEPTGYLATSEINGTTTTITNTHTPETTQRTVKKVWSDGDNLDGIRPTEIQVALYVGANMYTTSDSPKTLSAGEDGIWQESELTYTWTNLPKYLDGVEIPYEVREVNEPTGYLATSEVNGTTTTITNTHNPERTGCSVEKVWNDNNNQDGIRPESIQVQLNKNGSKYEAEGVTNPVTLNEANGWKYTWSNLIKNENGKAIDYTIAEIGDVRGYTTAYDTTSKAHTTIITNTHSSFSLNIVKYVKGLSIPLSGAGFKVSIKDESGKELANTSKVYITGANGKLTEPITGLTIDAEGKTYTVTITETQVPEGYEGIEGPITFNVKSVKSGNKFVLEQGEKTVTNSKKVTVGENEILVEAENAPEGTHKGVKEVTNQDSGYNGDEVHDWVITTKIPKDIAKYGKYVITDVIDERLVFSGLESVKVSIDGTNLTKDTDYKTEYNEGTRTLKIAFIEENFKGANLPEGKTIEIRFNTTFKLDENGNIIALNQTVPNQAELTYGNSEGAEVSLKTEIPEIHTGGVSIYKYDEETGVALEGATFKIATSKENAQNGVFVKDIKGNDITAKSNEKGIATFSGLEFGEDALNKAEYVTTDEITGATVYRYDWTKVSTNYYIVETEAPEGFNKSEDIYEVVIRKDSNEVVEIKDLISVANNKKIYDLSLRKFITKIDDKEVTDRIPDVDITPLVDGTSTTATYNHPKDPVLVAQNQLVTYTIRVFNEGPEDAYASLIKDDIPEGLEFVQYTEGDGSTNDTYKWKLVDENDNEVTDVTKAKYIVSDYLAKDAEEKNLLKGFNPEAMTELDYRDVQVQFKVIEPNTSDRVIINYAQIADDSDEGGNFITDKDSTPNEWKGEDDEDIEKIKVLYFDLALRKWVTQAIVTENGQTQITETGHKAEDDPEEVVKVDLKKSKLSNVIVKFRYSIRITNEGEIAGEAQEISDYIPQGLVFIPEDNPDWRQEEGKVVTEKLKGKTLQPGESAEVEILLTWVNSENNMGVMVNTAEISKDYNEYGSPDIDSTPNNKVPGEDDIDDAPVMLTIKTGSEIIMIVTLGLGVIAIIGAGVEIIRKKVIRN